MTLEAFVATRAEDLEALFRLRYRVFTAEQSKYQRIADHAGQRLVDDFDAVATHLAVAQGGRIVGGLRQLRGRRHASAAMVERLGLAWLDHLADQAFGFSGRLCIEPELRGGRALMCLLALNYRTALADGVRFDFIFCNPHLITQYEALGYRRYHRSYADAELGWQSPMVLDGCDRAHLQACGSPFAAMIDPAAARPPDPVVQAMLIPDSQLDGVRARALARCMQVRAGRALGDSAVALLVDWLQSAPLLAAAHGLVVAPRGTPGRELFVVECGRVRLELPGGEVRIAMPGDTFGLDALQRRAAHEVQASALGPTRIVAVSDRQLELALRRQAADAAELLGALQGRAQAAELQAG
jgi:predicted GNAT family N-acyltransferase